MYESRLLVEVKTINHLFTDAIFHKKPLVIVEGKDDPKKFRNIFEKSSNKKPLIKASELINKNEAEKYGAGYKGVSAIIKDLFDNPIHNKNDLFKYILGVIDKDSSKYCERTGCDYPILYVLKYYSIESYFISKESIGFIFDFLIDGENHNLTDQIFENNYEKFKIFALEQLYYPSLEALKLSCVDGYDCIGGYSTHPSHIKNMVKDDLYLPKISSLDSFALDKNIQKNFDFLFDICKGKWFLARFIEFSLSESGKLENLCSDSVKCDYCAENLSDKCVYKVEGVIHANAIEKYLFNSLPKMDAYKEFDDIVSRYDLMFQ